MPTRILESLQRHLPGITIETTWFAAWDKYSMFRGGSGTIHVVTVPFEEKLWRSALELADRKNISDAIVPSCFDLKIAVADQEPYHPARGFYYSFSIEQWEKLDWVFFTHILRILLRQRDQFEGLLKKKIRRWEILPDVPLVRFSNRGVYAHLARTRGMTGKEIASFAPEARLVIMAVARAEMLELDKHQPKRAPKCVRPPPPYHIPGKYFAV